MLAHYIFTETPYGRQSHRRTWSKQRKNFQDFNSSTAYSNKDDDLVHKIHFYQDIMNKRGKHRNNGDAFKQGTRYDFTAWYEAHYNNRYEKDGQPIPEHEKDIRETASNGPYTKEFRVPPGYPQTNVYKLRPSRPQAWRPPTNVERQMEKQQQVEDRRDLRRIYFMVLATFFTIFGMVFVFEPSAPLHRPPSVDDNSKSD